MDLFEWHEFGLASGTTPSDSMQIHQTSFISPQDINNIQNKWKLSRGLAPVSDSHVQQLIKLQTFLFIFSNVLLFLLQHEYTFLCHCLKGFKLKKGPRPYKTLLVVLCAAHEGFERKERHWGCNTSRWKMVCSLQRFSLWSCRAVWGRGQTKALCLSPGGSPVWFGHQHCEV